MLPFHAHKNSDGFTLIETVIILLIVGILSALSAPSFLGLMNRSRVNNAVAQARGALQEAQREAIRKSKNCTVIVPVGSNVTLKSPPEDSNNNGVLDAGEDINGNNLLDTNNCLVTGGRTLTGITIRRDATSLGIISFDFKGRITPLPTALNFNKQAIVFSSTSDTSSERCLMISNPLGLIRTGIYSDTQHSRTTVDPTTLATDPNCKISQ